MGIGKKRFLQAISMQYIFADLAYLTAGKIQSSIDADIERFLKWENLNCGKILKLNSLLKQYPYRNVFYYRMKSAPKVAKVFSLCSRLLIPKCKTIEISGKIGEGMLISHNFSVIRPSIAGKNLRVGPGVVIGRNGGIILL